jgi:hypothetical protein
MRWHKDRANIGGDERTVCKFLLTPVECHGEVRWLEYAWMKQRWVRNGTDSCYRWTAVEFIEPPPSSNDKVDTGLEDIKTY